MTTRVRTSVLAVALAVVAAVLVGSVAGDDEAGAATQRTLRIPAAAFVPSNGAIGYYNWGSAVFRGGTGGPDPFVAPVLLEGNEATVHRVTLHYYDNGASAICARLHRSTLKATSPKTMSQICTAGAVDASRARTDTTIKAAKVGPGNAAYLYVTIPPGSYALYGVTIVYTSDL